MREFNTSSALKVVVLAMAVGILALIVFGRFFETTPGVTERIPTEEIPVFAARASAGDIESVRKLVNHYLFFADDNKSALFWA